MNYLVLVAGFLARNPYLIALAVGGVASLLVREAPTHPRINAFLKLLAHLGINVAGVTQALTELVRGAPPTKVAEALLTPTPPT